MIHATSLRLGNLILEAGEIKKVYQLSIGGKTYDSINYQHVNRETGLTESGEDRFMPIPLTPEWLTANDFVDTEDSYYRRCIQNEDTLSPTMLVISRGFAEITRSGIGAVAAPCKYVHQLQNLYFALTGQELTIKEKV